MIPKREILEIATSHNLSPHVIEKDYVLGWILAGIHQHVISQTWVFKGGTCLKKCYFDTYRFSEDLDFTLSDPAHIDADFLSAAFTEISEWICQRFIPDTSRSSTVSGKSAGVSQESPRKGN